MYHYVGSRSHLFLGGRHALSGYSVGAIAQNCDQWDAFTLDYPRPLNAEQLLAWAQQRTKARQPVRSPRPGSRRRRSISRGPNSESGKSNLPAIGIAASGRPACDVGSHLDGRTFPLGCRFAGKLPNIPFADPLTSARLLRHARRFSRSSMSLATASATGWPPQGLCSLPRRLHSRWRGRNGTSRCRENGSVCVRRFDRHARRRSDQSRRGSTLDQRWPRVRNRRVAARHCRAIKRRVIDSIPVAQLPQRQPSKFAPLPSFRGAKSGPFKRSVPHSLRQHGASVG